jgi:hypothetical protein
MGRRIVIPLFIVMVILSFNSADAQVTVVGQNSPAVDIQAIQKAVDQGGIVNLKGTFDFGNEGRVNITKDVQIIGETIPGGPLTKIKGGFWAFYSPHPAQLPLTAPGPKITIKSIHFDGSLGNAIHLAYSSGATITGNKITNIRPKAADFPIFGKTGLNYQHGIFCGTSYAQRPATPKYIPDAFNGLLTIADNDIDMTNDVPTKTMAQGVMVMWTTGINAQIQRNTILNCARNSIETIDNHLGKDGSGTIVIKDNKIVTSIEGIAVPTPSTPIGMVIGWFLDLSGGLDPQRNIKYIIVSNAIRTRGKTSCGIALFTDGVVLVNNAILSEGTEALPLFIASSDGYIAYNKVEGDSVNPAIMVRPWKPFKASKNVVVDNDLKQFKSSKVDVLLAEETCNNLFVGPACKVGNLGSNNSVQMTK